jgi:hypothetical protein
MKIARIDTSGPQTAAFAVRCSRIVRRGSSRQAGLALWPRRLVGLQLHTHVLQNAQMNVRARLSRPE